MKTVEIEVTETGNVYRFESPMYREACDLVNLNHIRMPEYELLFPCKIYDPAHPGDLSKMLQFQTIDIPRNELVYGAGTVREVISYKGGKL